MIATIVITTYRQAVILEYILCALLAQVTLYDFDIIVCDDGSEDNSYDIISKYRQNTKGINIAYNWQQDRRFRAAAARNSGIINSKGRFIILLDGDMIPATDYVQKHVKYHLNNPGSLLSGGRLTIDDSIFFEFCKLKPNFLKTLSCIDSRSFLNIEELEMRKKWYHSNKSWMAMFSCNLSFPKSDYSKYSELFIGWGIEDWDISLRLYKKHNKIHFDENIIAYHVDYKPVISNAFRNNDHLQMAEFARNLLMFIDQYPEEDLVECAIALSSYQIKNNRLQWVGDGNKLRTISSSIEVIRKWLSDNNIYTKGEPFFIEQEFNNTKVITGFNELTLESIKEVKSNFDQIQINVFGINPNDLSKIKRLANNESINIKINC